MTSEKNNISEFTIFTIIILLYFIQTGDYIFSRYFLPIVGFFSFIFYLLFLRKEKLRLKVDELIVYFFIYFSTSLCILFSAQSISGAIFDYVKVFFAYSSFIVGYYTFSRINSYSKNKKDFILYNGSSICIFISRVLYKSCV
ncbi:hypothetical protein CS022_00075 [Veronia nyctiphanis]|uniref:Uncharacterized protein n=1 Tax=Veronia nyctiphanis TaxID=1278244 RepID=A0A4V1LTC2_9GAMM|nr:hypothetical protein CS022_00075 [Veronia nyctiphanis]